MDRMPERREIMVAEAQAGTRLDRALEALLPGTGLRLRRRFIESGRVLVNGAPKTPAYKVRPGQMLVLSPEERDDSLPAGVRLVARSAPVGRGGLAAVYKPQGIHSARVAGGGPSLEDVLGGLFPGERPVLLNRLDFLTSGLLLAALSDADREEWTVWEAEGRVTKTYAAVACGGVTGSLVLRKVLDTDDRARTRVLDRDTDESTRWTEVEPVRFLPELVAGGGATLLRVRIRRGARHQIRAHLAGAGHPLVGDELYGGPAADRLYLHHGRVESPGFTAEAGPDWTL